MIRRLLQRFWRTAQADIPPVLPTGRGPQTHVIMLDGTMSSLVPECQTNVGRAYSLLREMGSAVQIYYEPGLQWRDWRSARNVLMGRGINAQIKRAYSHLASRYRPGDRIFLMGYSRGAYAVRSLAGVLDRVGLLRAEHATERNIRDAYRHYECAPDAATLARFRELNCHDAVEIDMIGVWDTVKSLGINAPVLWRISERYEAARPLANIPLVWVLKRAEDCGLPLPEGWSGRFAQDALAPSVGTWRGYGRLLITRRKRVVGADASEQVHPSVATRASEQTGRRWYHRRDLAKQA